MSGTTIPVGDFQSRPFQSSDRTWLLDQKQEQQLARKVTDELAHYESLGLGLAAMCQSFCAGLLAPGVEQSLRFSREEVMRLLEAALRGR